MRTCYDWSKWPAHLRSARRFLVALVLCGSAQYASAAPGLTAKLDRDTITLGESVTLSLVFEDAYPREAPSLPIIPNVRVAAGVSQSQSISIFNGVRSQSVTFDYTLAPTQLGEIVIPAIEVKLGNRTLASQSLKLKVLKTNTSIPTPGGQDALAYLKLVLPKTRFYVGEAVPVEIQLYAQEGRLLRLPQLQGEGFTIGKLSEPAISRTRVNNQAYEVATFKVLVVPAKNGALTLGPATLDLAVPDLNRMPDIFGRRPQRQVTLASESQSVEIMPLPKENLPAGFNGAVGSYSLAVTASPTDLAAGDPITVKIRITGRGLLDGLILPAQPDWREFKTYPPSSKIEPMDAIGLSGVKTFEQVVVPQNSEIKSLPPFLFSFFDPEQKKYRTVTSNPITLTVQPGGASPAAPTNYANAAESSSVLPMPQDIVHIKPHLGNFAAVGMPLIQQRWFLAIQAVPVLLWLSLLVRRKHVEKAAANPRLRRQKEVARIVRAGVRELRQFAAANQPDQFFATLFRLLQEQLGERLDLPASAITEAVIDQRLRGGELSDESLSALHELFQACNVARYARHNSQELVSLVPKLESALRDLQNLKQA